MHAKSIKLNPHIIYLPEHCSVEQNLVIVNFGNSYLDSNFSRKSHSGGGVCILITSNLEINILDISQLCIEKIFEACAVQITIGNHFIIIICIYRSPSRNFCHFLKQLELILTYVNLEQSLFYVGILMLTF